MLHVDSSMSVASVLGELVALAVELAEQECMPLHVALAHAADLLPELDVFVEEWDNKLTGLSASLTPPPNG